MKNSEGQPWPPDIGRRLYGVAAIAFGIIGLTWGNFNAIYQPVADDLPYRTLLAYFIFACLLVAGVAVQVRRVARPALVITTATYVLFAFGWTRRIALLPHIFSVWNGCAQQLALASAGVVAYALVFPGTPAWSVRAADLARGLFGLCALSFGVEHFYELGQTARMVPPWLPPGQHFWAIATGIAFLLAGLAILAGVRTALAAGLLTLMFFVFAALVHAPALVSRGGGGHFVWTANAVNFAAAAAAWIVADWSAVRPGIRTRPAPTPTGVDSRSPARSV